MSTVKTELVSCVKTELVSSVKTELVSCVKTKLVSSVKTKKTSVEQRNEGMFNLRLTLSMHVFDEGMDSH